MDTDFTGANGGSGREKGMNKATTGQRHEDFKARKWRKRNRRTDSVGRGRYNFFTISLRNPHNMGADVVVQSNTMKSIQDSIGQPVARLGNVNAFLCLAGLFALFATSARASDPNGVYAFVDKVVFEPSEAAPLRALLPTAR